MRKQTIYSSFLILLAAVNPFFSSAQQRQQTADSMAVVHTMDVFVEAFTRLDWPVFTACFADSATAFFPPSAKFPYRAGNKTEVLKIFSKVFENARKIKTSPPYLPIEPRELKIQMLGTVAIVTFILDDPDLLGRRTLVLKKDQDKWLIIHLHASGMAIPK
ncbi:MAG: nuclear transport factor 2 family protein [Chitinophagaceae bacterium]|nr:nuclear transport factor 2 family protein [Chitinophagaceae bacterium]